MSEQLVAALAPGNPAGVENLTRLSGGANMETWSFDLSVEGCLEPLILRRLPGGAQAAGQEVSELDLATEVELLKVAGQHKIAVPIVRHVLAPEYGLGEGYIMSRERGEALPSRLLADPRYQNARQKLAFQCGVSLGRIHQIPLSQLPDGLPDHRGELLVQHYQSELDELANPSPVLQLGLNWLRDNPRTQPRSALVHGDFRNGNLLVDEEGLVAVLDWELAHLGDPVQDLGYITGNVWRFGAEPPVGGFGQYEDLLEGYQSVTGQAPSMADIHYWQVHTALSWGTVCLKMLDMYRSGRDPSLERAAIGRRLSEAEVDLLLLLDGEL